MLYKFRRGQGLCIRLRSIGKYEGRVIVSVKIGHLC